MHPVGKLPVEMKASGLASSWGSPMSKPSHPAPSRREIREAFGRTLRTLRIAAGISQEALALQCSIDRSYMSGLERGLHIPSVQTVYRLLPILKVDLVDFAAELDYNIKHQK
jgi:ribosome-binding protein aMBF1 (putative translation factor)